MTAEMTKGAQIRGALLKYRERNRYGKYPQELQLPAVEYSIQRRRAGASVAEIAAELGVHEVTAKAWTAATAAVSGSSSIKSMPSAGLSLVPVVVRQEPALARLTRLEVEFSDGTRLVASGVGGSDLVDAIEALRRTR